MNDVTAPFKICMQTLLKSAVYTQIIVFLKHQAKINSHLIKTFFYVVHTRPFEESATELSGKTEHRQQTHQLKTIAIYSQNNSSNFFFLSLFLYFLRVRRIKIKRSID